MDRRRFLTSVAAGAVGGLAATPSFVGAGKLTPASAGPDRKDVEAAVERGLEYLKREQKQDGHWEAPNGMYPTAMTALAGMSFLMEGSTLRMGKYTDQINAGVKWITASSRVRPNGLIGNTDNQLEQLRYMYGHGFSTMFLASCYGEEEDDDQRKQLKLEEKLRKAVEFTGNAQTKKKHRKPEGKEVDIGGWGYVHREESQPPNFDEGSVTITQLQALRACKNAGIPVPVSIVEKAVAYLEACTTASGGIIYSYSMGSKDERPALTAAALACAISSGEFTHAIEVMNRKDPPPPTGVARPNVLRWFEYCRRTLFANKGRTPHQEYQTYYLSQAMYMLGDDRYGLLFPNDPKETWLTWSKYKEAVFPSILEAQNPKTGGWEGTGDYGCGPVYITAVHLTVLQLEKAILPIYQR
jgi:hypothetical protein